MAHAIETNTNGASFAYSGKIGSAWHRLGVELPDLSDVDTILAAARADYTVEKAPLLVQDPTQERYSAANTIDTGSYFTWREAYDYDDDGVPTDTYRQVLGIVGETYETIQNREALEFALELAGMAPDEPNVDCAGVLDNGQRFFATIPLPELVIDPNGINDRYGRNLVVVTGHNGKQALEVVNGFTRAVCANTVAAALRSNYRYKIRHVAGIERYKIEAKRALSLALTADEEFQEIAQNLLDIDCKWGDVEKVIDKQWPLVDNPNDRQRHESDKRKATINEIWNSDRCVANYGENRYSAFQAITEYMEHRQHMVGEQTPENRAYRAAFSPGFNQRVAKMARVLQMKRPTTAMANA